MRMSAPIFPYERSKALAATIAEPGPVLGIDIGGTKLAAGVVAPDGRVLSYSRQPTQADLDAAGLLGTVLSVSETARQESSQEPVAVGIGCGGPIFFEEDTVSPLHMPAWRGFPLRPRLEASLELPAVLDNDAKAFALGEALFGAGRGARYMLGMVVSTGIGGGIVVDGRLLDGAHGNGGHIGHTIVSVRGPRCFCGAIGCLTAYAAGRGLSARAVASLKRGATSTLATLPHGSLTGRDIVEAAASGDELAGRLLREAASALGRGIASAANILDLDRVVLGGGLLNAGELLLAPLRRELRRRARLAFSRHVDLRTSELGKEAGVVGAASLILQHWQ